MNDAYRERFWLHSTLPVFRRRVERAEMRVHEWAEKIENPYIAFSGGKDSTCVLHLVRSQRPETTAIYFDAQCAFPEVESLLAETPNCIKYAADEPFLGTLARYGLDDPAVEEATMQTTVWGPIRRLIAEYEFDGVAYGLRAEENSKTRGMHARTRGAVFQYKRDGLWGCQPIHDWSYLDVWAYIVSNNLPYAGVYDKMWEMPERDQRVSYWAGETNRTRGRFVWLRQHYPDLWRRLRAAVPEAANYI